MTIVGGLFTIAANPPFRGWGAAVAPYGPLRQVPVVATFGVLAFVACLPIAYDLGNRLGHEPIVPSSRPFEIPWCLTSDGAVRCAAFVPFSFSHSRFKLQSPSSLSLSD